VAATDPLAWLAMDAKVSGVLPLTRLLQTLPAGDDPLAKVARAAARLGPLGRVPGAFDATLRGHIGEDARRSAAIAIRLLHPLKQRMRRAADLPRYRGNRRPARRLLAFMIQHHPHRTVADLRRKLVCPRRTRHGTTFLAVGASVRPGAVQSDKLRRERSLADHACWRSVLGKLFQVPTFIPS
jgi:hypothetical protein